jgi:hypothetical protein
MTSKRGAWLFIPGQLEKPPNMLEIADAAPKVIEPSPFALSDKDTSVIVRNERDLIVRRKRPEMIRIRSLVTA